MSSSVLYQRLRELHAAGLIERDEDERYVLSKAGQALLKAIDPLSTWAKTWL
jgi:DNA-binding HxlR family transcriptional regulator